MSSVKCRLGLNVLISHMNLIRVDDITTINLTEANCVHILCINVII